MSDYISYDELLEVAIIEWSKENIKNVNLTPSDIISNTAEKLKENIQKVASYVYRLIRDGWIEVSEAGYVTDVHVFESV